MLGKLFRARKGYKDIRGVLENPASGMGDILYGVFRPMIAMTTAGSFIVAVVMGILRYGVGAKFTGAIFWIAVVIFIMTRVSAWLIKRWMNRAMNDVAQQAEKTFTNIVNERNDIDVQVEEVESL